MENNLQDKFKEEFPCGSDVDPLEGHFERFESRLAKKNQEKPIRMWNFKKFGLLAACLAGLIFMAVYLLNPSSPNIAETNETEDGADFSLTNYSIAAGLKEAYYTAELNKLSVSAESRNDIEIQELFKVLDRLDKEYTELNNKLKTNFRNEHLINAVLENYRLRLELMEKIQKVIQVKNKIKNTNHGNKIS